MQKYRTCLQNDIVIVLADGSHSKVSFGAGRNTLYNLKYIMEKYSIA